MLRAHPLIVGVIGSPPGSFQGPGKNRIFCRKREGDGETKRERERGNGLQRWLLFVTLSPPLDNRWDEKCSTETHRGSPGSGEEPGGVGQPLVAD